MITNRIPKQVTKAPSGAAVSSMPLHEAVIPLDKISTADILATSALAEWRQSLTFAQLSTAVGDRQGAASHLNDAAEFRRVYVAFRKAINVMGGL